MRKTVTITCPEAWVKPLMSLMDALQTVTGVDSFTFEANNETKPAAARVYYKAVDLATAPAVLRGMGEGSIKGKIFAEVVNATLQGRKVTEKEITAKFQFPPKTTQARLVGLRKDNLVVAEKVEG